MCWEVLTTTIVASNPIVGDNKDAPTDCGRSAPSLSLSPLNTAVSYSPSSATRSVMTNHCQSIQSISAMYIK